MVASISCIYGIGNPVEFHKNVVNLEVGQRITRNDLLHRLVTSLYSRAVSDFKRGNFRVKGDTVDIHLAYADHAVRVEFWDDEEIERISTIDPESGSQLHVFEQISIYPANLFVSSKETTNTAVWRFNKISESKDFSTKQARFLESKRLDERTLYDLEMIKKLGSARN